MRAINQGRTSPLTSPEWSSEFSDTQICRFSQKFRPKTKISVSTEFHCLKFLDNQLPIERYQHFGRRWPRSRKVWAPTLNRKDARFTFHTRRDVQSAIVHLVSLFLAPFITEQRLPWIGIAVPVATTSRRRQWLAANYRKPPCEFCDGLKKTATVAACSLVSVQSNTGLYVTTVCNQTQSAATAARPSRLLFRDEPITKYVSPISCDRWFRFVLFVNF